MQASQKLLQNQLKTMLKEPVEGFKVELCDDSDIYKWRCYIQGPPDTPYQGGIFQQKWSFQSYPFEPPTLTFTSGFWHPNVESNGKVCISILHAPGEDEMSGERPEERWNPTQTPETILLSIISLLSDPNIFSPANVDAGVEYRDKREAFKVRVKKLIEKANAALPSDFEMPKPKKIEVPSTPIDNGDYDFEIEEDDSYEEDVEEEEEDDLSGDDGEDEEADDE
ncbi:ubiquitin conjugating enzyme E2 [Acrasis kona]|uniref:Ubiquitin conjugating enzyme E2 n=1 Tax=Acrasis kona TaxID=1008807 RepID=A0AAW2ZM80_9EUKA